MAAIYCPPWPKDLEVTTTPYPVDVTEAMVFGISMTSSSMDALPNDSITGTGILASGYHYQSRWFYTDGPYDDAIQGTADLVSGYHYQARWFYIDGPYVDALQGSADVVSAYHANKLVEVDTPDEELQLTCTISDTCSMTGI